MKVAILGVGAGAVLVPALSPRVRSCCSSRPPCPLASLDCLGGADRGACAGLHLCLAQGTLSEQSPSRFFMSLIGDLQTLK